MNILHLKYAVEVERTGSITQAAENLYMGQPNLSKAIKELESNIGTTIFKRTSKGVLPTPRGAEFLAMAKKILSQIEHMEAIFVPGTRERQRLSISIPRASYLALAFTNFVKLMDEDKEIDLDYKETNSTQAIQNILQEESTLAVIRYPVEHEKYFKNLLNFKSLSFETLWDFEYLAVMSERHPLAKAETVKFEDLAAYTEITHGDLETPHIPVTEAPKTEEIPYIKRRIFVYERGSQFELLCSVPTTYMWVSAIPRETLERYGLVQRKCAAQHNQHRDVLVYKKGYKFNAPERLFINELKRVRDEIAQVQAD